LAITGNERENTRTKYKILAIWICFSQNLEKFGPFFFMKNPVKVEIRFFSSKFAKN
jgi:hypothetical protein